MKRERRNSGVLNLQGENKAHEGKKRRFPSGNVEFAMKFVHVIYISNERKQSETYKKLDCDPKAIPLHGST